MRRIASPDYLNAGPLRATFVAIVNEDLRPLLPAIKCPTLLVWGDQDEETPLADARVMENQYGRLRLALIPFLNG